MLALVWGCNWPVLKMGVSELPPLTFRALTLPFAALGLLLVAKLSGEAIGIPRGLRLRVALLALFNIGGWNALVLFGVEQLPAGRSAIIAYTMPIWSVLFSLVLLHEPLDRRKIAGLVLGMIGMAVLLGDDVRHLQRAPTAALFILGAALCWAFGAVLLRKWKLAAADDRAVGLDDAAGLDPHRRAGARSSPPVRCPSSRRGRGSRSSTTSSSPGRWRIGRGSRWCARCRSRCRRWRRCRCPSSACSPAC